MSLEETVENVQPKLIFKDFKLKVPDDGTTYYYYGYIQRTSWGGTLGYTDVSKCSDYDKDTGTWKGYMIFYYDKEAQVWKADLLNKVKYRNGSSYMPIEDQDFIDACTITLDEAKAMSLDNNTNVDPAEFLIYDRYSAPGTPGSN